MTVKIEIIRSQTCPFCQPAVDLIKGVTSKYGDKVEVIEIDTGTPEGKERADKERILGVPTTLVNGKIAFVGMPRTELVQAKIEQEMRNE